jgi:hypothetical protein
MDHLWALRLNGLLGSLVVALGAWLAWDQLRLEGAVLVWALVIGLLMWQGKTLGLVWAWATLLLGVESFVWPVVTMVQIRAVTDQPSDLQMGTILSAVFMGLFSAVFWLAFSYGLFRRAGIGGMARSPMVEDAAAEPGPQKRRKP